MTPASLANHDDEVSITELLATIWAKRGIVTLAPLLATLLAIAFLSASKISNLNTVTAYIELQGIAIVRKPAATRTTNEDQEEFVPLTETAAFYPNGVEFSPEDLIHPSVIESVSTNYKLPADKLLENLTVQFGTPTSKAVIREFESALENNQKASPETISALSEQYSQKISIAAKRGVSLNLNYRRLGISQQTGQQLLADLPKIWNKVFTTEFNIFIPPAVLSQQSSLIGAQLDSTLGFLTAEEQLASMEAGLEALVQDSRLGLLQSASGTTASDLVKEIKTFKRIYFEPLYINAFSKKAGLASIYKENISLEIIELEKRTEELSNRLRDIVEFRRGDTVNSAPGGENNATGGAQYDGSALSEVISLAEAATLSSYLESTLTKRTLLFEQLSDLQTKLARISWKNSDYEALPPSFVADAQRKFNKFTASYSELVAAAQSKLAENKIALYSPLNQPTSLARLFVARDALIVIFWASLALMLSVLWAILRPSKPTPQTT